MYKSRFKDELEWRYKIKHFLAFTEKGKEALITLIQFLVCVVAVAYFGSHFIIWLTGGYEQPIIHLVTK